MFLHNRWWCLFPNLPRSGFRKLVKKHPCQKLIEDAAGRGSNSVAARNALENASKIKNMNPAKALAEVAKQYAAKYTTGLGTKPLRTTGLETSMAALVGTGYGAPEFLPTKMVGLC